MIPKYIKKQIIASIVEPEDTNVLWLQLFPNDINVVSLKYFSANGWIGIEQVTIPSTVSVFNVTGTLTTGNLTVGSNATFGNAITTYYATVNSILTGNVGTFNNLTVNTRFSAPQLHIPLTEYATPIAGDLYMNADGELSFMYADGTTLNIGFENWIAAVNKTGAQLLNGKSVYINGGQGNKPTLNYSDSSDAHKANAVGVLTMDVNDNAVGKITTMGVVHGIDTRAFTEGAELFIDGNGLITTVLPDTGFVLFIGYALNSTVNGSILVLPARPLGVDLSSNAADIAPTIKAVNNSLALKEDKYIILDFWQDDVPEEYISGHHWYQESTDTLRVCVDSSWEIFALNTKTFYIWNTIYRYEAGGGLYDVTGVINLTASVDTKEYKRTILAVIATLNPVPASDDLTLTVLRNDLTVGELEIVKTSTGTYQITLINGIIPTMYCKQQNTILYSDNLGIMIKILVTVSLGTIYLTVLDTTGTPIDSALDNNYLEFEAF